ncbi:MAG TPA: bifunctional UDP-N-acetylglucosamine diphosphorylase/glucosamine-1-phosphate N-acetyltransferase GlmU [Candidatus Deferrimicrobiaceae bacterium]
MDSVGVVVLAAGLGKRMKSALPKVAHVVAGRSMAWRVANAARSAGVAEIVFVLGHGRDKLLEAAAAFGAKIAIQDRQSGTGDAARCGLAELSPKIRDVVVLCGDAVMMRPATIKALVAARRKRKAAASVLTGMLPDPAGYGRIVRDRSGNVSRIVEERDATPDIKKITEVNSGSYAFDRAFLSRSLPRLNDVNAQREYYLTDTVIQALEEGRVVVPIAASDPDEVRGINSRRELAEVGALLVRKKTEALMDAGVTLVDPRRVWIEPEVKIGADCVIESPVTIAGDTRIGKNVRIQMGCVIEDSIVGDNVHLRPYSILTGARVEKGAIIGPFAHLRPEADIGEGAHVGNFVEVKKSRIGAGSKANHLAYIGDATIGKKANIGAGTITCNYDGLAKHKTFIGDGVFIGSDTQLVAPVKVGKGALVAAGTTVTKDVPPFALALSRAPQKNIEGWVAKKKPELLAKSGLKAPKFPKAGKGE